MIRKIILRTLTIPFIVLLAGVLAASARAPISMERQQDLFHDSQSHRITQEILDDAKTLDRYYVYWQASSCRIVSHVELMEAIGELPILYSMKRWFTIERIHDKRAIEIIKDKKSLGTELNCKTGRNYDTGIN